MKQPAAGGPLFAPPSNQHFSSFLPRGAEEIEEKSWLICLLRQFTSFFSIIRELMAALAAAVAQSKTKIKLI